MIGYEDKVFRLDNGKGYIIIKSVWIDVKNYAYIVNVDDEMDTAFIEIVHGEDGMIFKQIFDQKVIKGILNSIA